jgi:hypothetical protein
LRPQSVLVDVVVVFANVSLSKIVPTIAKVMTEQTAKTLASLLLERSFRTIFCRLVNAIGSVGSIFYAYANCILKYFDSKTPRF